MKQQETTRGYEYPQIEVLQLYTGGILMSSFSQESLTEDEFYNNVFNV